MTHNAELLAAENEGLVRYALARWFPRLARMVDEGRTDIWDYGVHLLTLAARRYDPARGKFSTFATAAIRLGMRGRLRGVNRQRAIALECAIRRANQPKSSVVAALDIAAAVDTLPPYLRETWEAYVACGFDAKAAGVRIGMCRGSTWHRVQVAKQILRARLADYAA